MAQGTRPAAILVLLGAVGAAQAPEASAQAMAVYEAGKRCYDAKDYAGALRKFDEAAALEPGKARWHYNRGLALRKLKRNDEARDALLKARELEPDYKRKEIDEKLADLGPAPAPTGMDAPLIPGGAPPPTSAPLPAAPRPSQGSWGPCLGCSAVLLGGLVMVGMLVRKVVRAIRARSAGGGPRIPAMSEPARRNLDLSPIAGRMEGAAARLIAVEHALGIREDEDLRALLNQATQAEHRLREEMKRLRQGQGDPSSLDGLAAELEASAEGAAARARAVFGDTVFQSAAGEALGCYFCARPLASAAYRENLALKQGDQVLQVLACPPCANTVARGQAPPVRGITRADGSVAHWSSAPDFDPYVHRHRPYPGSALQPAWKVPPGGAMGGAALAAGGVIAGGLAAAGIARMLDLDGAREIGLAQEAARAAALRDGGGKPEGSDWGESTLRDSS